jgi:hypothetical protein
MFAGGRLIHTFLVSASAPLVGFARDLLGKSAATKSRPTNPDAIALALTLLASVASLFDSVQSLVTGAIGVPRALLPLATVCTALACAAFVIVAKIPIGPSIPESRIIGLDPPPTWERMYRFVGPVRNIAKVALLLGLLALPGTVRVAHDTLGDVPPRFSGYLVEAATGVPIVGATVRVITIEGVDQTRSVWPSDNKGLYVVTTSEPIRRDSYLQLYIEGCEPIALPLFRRFETRTSPSGDALRSGEVPIFLHVVGKCQGPTSDGVKGGVLLPHVFSSLAPK